MASAISNEAFNRRLAGACRAAGVPVITADGLRHIKQKRVAAERVQRVCAILATHLDSPPSLDQLGRQIGCSSHNLSRLFSEIMGMTIGR